MTTLPAPLPVPPSLRATIARPARLVLAATLAAQIIGATSLAHAVPPSAPDTARDEARERFRRGVDLYKEGDFRAALIEFRRAYDVAPNYRLLFNLGQASFEVQDHAAALRYFERYLSEGGKEIAPDRRAVVETEIKKLQARVAKLTVKVNVDGADVLIDDVVVGTSPLKEAVLVSAGRRRVGAQKTGLPPVARSIDLAGGDGTEIALELVETKAGPQTPPVAPTTGPVAADPAPSPPPPAPPPSTGMGTPFWASLGATVLFAGGATVTGLLAVSAHDKLETKLAQRGATHDAIEDDRSKTKTLALTTDVLGGLAIVGVGLTTYFGVTHRSGADAAKGTAVQLRLGPGSAALGGSF